jgi:hypothetical protein
MIRSILYSFLAFIVAGIILPACVNEDFENTFNNTAIKTEWSLPIGITEYKLSTSDFSGSSSDVPGSCGINYFNDLPFTQNNPYYERNDQQNLDIDVNNFINDNIESLSFRINIYNSYPTDVSSQIYLYADGHLLLDSVFKEGPKLISGGITDTSGRIVAEKYEMFDIPFNDRMEAIKQARTYKIHSKISTRKTGLKYIRFYDTSRIKIYTGVRALFHIKANQN